MWQKPRSTTTVRFGGETRARLSIYIPDIPTRINMWASAPPLFCHFRGLVGFLSNLLRLQLRTTQTEIRDTQHSHSISFSLFFFSGILEGFFFVCLRIWNWEKWLRMLEFSLWKSTFLLLVFSRWWSLTFCWFSA